MNFEKGLLVALQELECYLDSVSRLAHASAESAFLANAEYASIALMERLNSVMTKVRIRTSLCKTYNYSRLP